MQPGAWLLYLIVFWCWFEACRVARAKSRNQALAFPMCVRCAWVGGPTRSWRHQFISRILWWKPWPGTQVAQRLQAQVAGGRLNRPSCWNLGLRRAVGPGPRADARCAGPGGSRRSWRHQLIQFKDWVMAAMARHAGGAKTAASRGRRSVPHTFVLESWPEARRLARARRCNQVLDFK